MIIPVGDDTKRGGFPFMNYLLLAANIACFIYVVNSPKPEQLVMQYALVPSNWTVMSLFTSMFLHGDLWHLLGNMLFLWIVGQNVENRLGHIPYLIFYAAAGVAGAAGHMFMNPSSSVPCIGASGAISGIIGAYLVNFPTGQFRFLVLIFMKTFTASAWYSIGLWVGTQVALAKAQMNGATTNIAVYAHLAGFAAGVVGALVVRLFVRSAKEGE